MTGSIISEHQLPTNLRSIFHVAVKEANGGGEGGTRVSTQRSGTTSSTGSRKRKFDQLGEADERRRDRRDRDRRRRDHDGNHIGNLVGKLRENSYLCYAFSMATGAWYVGYSGGGGQFSNVLSSDADLERRNHRVDHYLRGVTPMARHGRPVNNCAEVSALSVAISYGEAPANLVFMTWSPNGHLVNPCPNCQQWILPFCYGYIGADGQLHRGH